MKEFILYVNDGSSERELARVRSDLNEVLQYGRGSDMDGQFGVGNLGISHHQFDVCAENGNLYVVNCGRGRMKRDRKEMAKDERIRVARGLKFKVSGVSFRFDVPSRNSANFELVIRSGASRRRYPLAQESVTVGRLKGAADIVVNTDGVSKIHFKLDREHSSSEPFHLYDLDSTNGVKLGPPSEQLIAPGEDGPVRLGQKIHFGSVCASIEQRRPFAKIRRMGLMVAAPLVVMAVLVLSSNKRDVQTCHGIIRNALSETNMWKRVDNIKTLAQSPNPAIEACSDCRQVLAFYGQQSDQLKQWKARASSLNSSLDALVNSYNENIWARDNQVLIGRSNAKNKLQDDLRNFGTPPLGAPALAPRKSSDSHKPETWPSLAQSAEIEAFQTAISDNAKQKLNAFSRVEETMAQISSGEQVDWDGFNESLKIFLPPYHSAFKQIDEYLRESAARKNDWERLMLQIENSLGGASPALDAGRKDFQANGLPKALGDQLERETCPQTYTIMRGYSDRIAKTKNDEVEVCTETMSTLGALAKVGLPPMVSELKETLAAYVNDKKMKWQKSADELKGTADELSKVQDPKDAGNWAEELKSRVNRGMLDDFRLPFDKAVACGMAEKAWNEVIRKIDTWPPFQGGDSGLGRDLLDVLTNLKAVEDELKRVGALREGNYNSVEARLKFLKGRNAQ